MLYLRHLSAFTCFNQRAKSADFPTFSTKKKQKRATIEAADFMPSCAKKACKIPVKLPSTFRQYSVQLLSIWTSIWTNSLTNYNKEQKNSGHVRQSPPCSLFSCTTVCAFLAATAAAALCLLLVNSYEPDNSPLIMFFFIQYL